MSTADSRYERLQWRWLRTALGIPQVVWLTTVRLESRSVILRLQTSQGIGMQNFRFRRPQGSTHQALLQCSKSLRLSHFSIAMASPVLGTEWRNFTTHSGLLYRVSHRRTDICNRSTPNGGHKCFMKDRSRCSTWRNTRSGAHKNICVMQLHVCADDSVNARIVNFAAASVITQLCIAWASRFNSTVTCVVAECTNSTAAPESIFNKTQVSPSSRTSEGPILRWIDELPTILTGVFLQDYPALPEVLCVLGLPVY